MARGKKKESSLTPEEKLAQALVPVEEQPYKVPKNWCWMRGTAIFREMETRKPAGEFFDYIDIDAIDNSLQVVTEPKHMAVKDAPSRASRAVHYGDTVFSLVRPYLKNIAFIDESLKDCIASTGFYICSPSSVIVPRYLYLLMTSSYVVDGLNQYMKGDNSPSIRKDDIELFAYPIPPLAEQQRIVDCIEYLFAKLDESKEKAQSVLDSFETRKAAILHKAFTGVLIGKDTPEATCLESIVETIRIGPFGSALHKEDYILDGVPVVNPKHIVGQQIIPEGKVAISFEKAEELSAYRLRKNDIVLGRRGEMGRSAPVTEEQAGWICGTGSLIIRLKPGYDAAFYSQIIASQPVVQYLEENSVGSTLKNLNERIVRKLPIPNFSLTEQKRTIEILSRILSKEQQAKEATETVLEKIDLLKKSILARAFRGELGTNDPTEESAVELLKAIL